MSRPDYATETVAGAGGVPLALDVWPTPPGGEQSPGFLLVHGLASNARLYDGVAARLVSLRHPAAAVDLRGHGRSGKPDEGYDYATLSADLVAVLERLTSRHAWAARPVAVGQSFGANLVLELAARHPELVRGVVCIDGGTIDLAARFPSFEEAWAALTPPQIAGTPLAELAERFSRWHPDWPAAGIAGSLANFEVRPDGTVAPWLTLDRHEKIVRTMWETSPRRLYGALAVPVLFLPADSPGAPEGWATAKREATAEALGALGRAEARWLPGDHDLHAQHPEAVAQALVEAAGTLFL